MNLLAQMFFDDSSSDDDDDFVVAALLLADVESKKRPKHGGSVPGHAVKRRLFEDDFADDPVFGPWTGSSKKNELKSKQKLENKLSFYTKVKDAATTLNAQKTISKKKKQRRRSRQKKLKAYDLLASGNGCTGAEDRNKAATGDCSAESCTEQPTVPARSVSRDPLAPASYAATCSCK